VDDHQRCWPNPDLVALRDWLDGRTIVAIGLGAHVFEQSPSSQRRLETKLSGYGVSLADIDQVFLTHWHPDHSGLASHIQSTAGARGRIHELDAPLMQDEGGQHGNYSTTAWQERGTPSAAPLSRA
jgi:glyoxylase-like metal-dependent hydrolase (beta-lactamase superfamily II)